MYEIKELFGFLESIESNNPDMIDSIRDAAITIFMESEEILNKKGKIRDLYLGGIAAYRKGDYDTAIAMWSQLIDKLQGKDKLKIAVYLQNVYRKSSLPKEERYDKIRKMNKLIYELEGNV